MNDKTIASIVDTFRQIQTQLDVSMFITALLASLAASCVAAGLYRFFYERRGTGSQVHRSFPLLGISITTLFIGVQISIPLSLGLLGALSIIRFRTPIKEPEEVGFIMLVIAASVSAATFQFRFIVILFAVAIAALCLMRGASAWRWLKRDGLLIFTMPETELPHMKTIEMALHKQVTRFRLETSSVRDGVATCQYVFSGLHDDVAALQTALFSVAPIKTVNVFLDRAGGIR